MCCRRGTGAGERRGDECWDGAGSLDLRFESGSFSLEFGMGGLKDNFNSMMTDYNEVSCAW